MYYIFSFKVILLLLHKQGLLIYCILFRTNYFTIVHNGDFTELAERAEYSNYGDYLNFMRFHIIYIYIYTYCTHIHTYIHNYPNISLFSNVPVYKTTISQKARG